MVVVAIAYVTRSDLFFTRSLHNSVVLLTLYSMQGKHELCFLAIRIHQWQHESFVEAKIFSYRKKAMINSQ
jgi:hypothetical protein